MPARRVEITVSEETWQEIEAARGEMPRAAWVKQVLRAALDGSPGSLPPDALGKVEAALSEIRSLLASDTGTDTV